PSKAIASLGSRGISTLTFGFAIINHLLPFRVGLESGVSKPAKMRQERLLTVIKSLHTPDGCTRFAAGSPEVVRGLTTASPSSTKEPRGSTIVPASPSIEVSGSPIQAPGFAPQSSSPSKRSTGDR